MRPNSPFDHRPDRALGRALRDLLSPEDHRAFVTRVIHAAQLQFRGPTGPSWWDILGAWLRPGLVAAVLIAGVAWIGAQPRQESGSATLADAPLADAGNVEETAWALALDPPDVDVVLVSGVDPAGRPLIREVP